MTDQPANEIPVEPHRKTRDVLKYIRRGKHRNYSSYGISNVFRLSRDSSVAILKYLENQGSIVNVQDDNNPRYIAAAEPKGVTPGAISTGVYDA